MLIAQDLNLLRPESASDCVRPHLEIMIPQDGKHALLCLEPPQGSSPRAQMQAADSVT